MEVEVPFGLQRNNEKITKSFCKRNWETWEEKKEVKEQEVRRLDFGSAETEQGNRVVSVKFKCAGECCLSAIALCVANIICKSSGRVYHPQLPPTNLGRETQGEGL